MTLSSLSAPSTPLGGVETISSLTSSGSVWNGSGTSVQTSWIETNELNATLATVSRHIGGGFIAQSWFPSNRAGTSVMKVTGPVPLELAMRIWPWSCAPRVKLTSVWSGDHAHSYSSLLVVGIASSAPGMPPATEEMNTSLLVVSWRVKHSLVPSGDTIGW